MEGEAQSGSAINVGFYSRADLVRFYDGDHLRPVEEVILDRYASDLSGRVLDVGCGAGRLAGHLIDNGADVHGIDISPRMIARCREAYPDAQFTTTDMRQAGQLQSGPFDALIASNNVLDALNAADRRRTLHAFREALAPGGLLVMSSHNLAYAQKIRGPVMEVIEQVRSGRVRGALLATARLPLSWRNHRRLRKLESSGPGYAIRNDVAHDFSLLHYYASLPHQVRQLATHGFDLIECLDPAGRVVDPGDPTSEFSEIHYVARASASS